MVDVGAKPLMRRTAVAAGEFVAAKATLDRLTGVEGDEPLPKGEGLAVARVAGIMAAKKCGELIPLCHPLPLDHVQVDFDRTADGPSGLPRWPNYSTACNGGSGGAFGGKTVHCGEIAVIRAGITTFQLIRPKKVAINLTTCECPIRQQYSCFKPAMSHAHRPNLTWHKNCTD